MLESLHALFQCLTRDLILSIKTASATEGVEDDVFTLLLGIGFPIRAFATDSCALDKYDMPVARKRPPFPI